jgi:tellurite resistance protein TerC
MQPTPAAWLALVGGIVLLLLLDLFVLHRGTKEISMRNAAWSSAFFVAAGVVFGVILWSYEGAGIGQEFFAGYLLEYSLSLDNVFVWAVIFGAFSVPTAYQHRVLFYGIFGALVLRGAFVAAGSQLLQRFEWIVYVFGALLLFSGVRMLRRGGQDDSDPQNSRAVKLLKRVVPTTERLERAHLFIPHDETPEDDRPAKKPLFGRYYATPMLAVLVVIETSDVIFAVDSIPAIFGVTREPYVVFAATALALVGLRSMYFLLANARDRFVYLDLGLAVILIFVGLKFMLTEIVEIGVAVSLGVIVVVMGGAIAASLLRSRARATAGHR